MKQLVTIMLLLGWFNINSVSNTEINVENVRHIAQVRQISFNNTVIRDLAFQLDSSRLAIINLIPQTTLDGEVIFLDSQTLEEFTPPNKPIRGTALTFSPDGSLFAVGSEHGQISIYDAVSLETRWTYQTSPDIVNDLAISPNNAYLGASFAIPTIRTAGDDAFRLLTLSSGGKLLSRPLDNELDGIYGGGVTFDDASQFVFFSTTNMTTQNGIVYTYEIATKNELPVHDGYASNEHELLFEPQYRELYYVGIDGVHIISPYTDNPIQDRLIGSIS